MYLLSIWHIKISKIAGSSIERPLKPLNQINKENSINRQYNTERKGCIQDKKNIENNKININNGVFIEDRDEYSIKETFSRDRFSFKPTFI